MNAKRRTMSERMRRLRESIIRKLGHRLYELVTFPWLVAALMYNPAIKKHYGLTWRSRYALAWRMYRNSFRMKSATSWKAHLAMAVKILELPPTVPGVVVECGCFQGAASTNLSLVCDIVDRELVLYDSFEGLPEPAHGEKYGNPWVTGSYKGELDVVKANIAKGGVLERCTFRKGWFKDTVPHHTEPIALLFLDVDFQDSLHDCVLHLWPHVSEKGYVFIDEYVFTDYCAFFYSERWWRQYLDTVPPGLFGAGTGVPLGQFSLDTWPPRSPLQSSSSIAWTRKGNTGYWDFYPDEIAEGTAPAEVLARGTQPMP